MSGIVFVPLETVRLSYDVSLGKAFLMDLLSGSLAQGLISKWDMRDMGAALKTVCHYHDDENVWAHVLSFPLARMALAASAKAWPFDNRI